MIAVKEFITRIEQGYAQAILCRGDNGHLYVVKSRRSGKESLIREWICGRIGLELGLPVPPFEMIYADQSLASYSANEDLAALSDTPGFGSRFVITGSEGVGSGLPILNAADVVHVDSSLRLRILLFDWWILNFDRTEDNPNLLWDPVIRKVHVIDHNLAFDSSLAEEFWEHHIFRADRHRLSDPIQRATDLQVMKTILDMLPKIWAEMPDPWTEVSGTTLAAVDKILRRCENDDFW